MQISVSIEPFLSGEKAQLRKYIEKIISLSKKLSRDDCQVSLHFDYFKYNLDVFQLVQSYTKQIQIDLHLMSEPAPSIDGFRSVSFDVIDVKSKKNKLLMANLESISDNQFGLVFDLGYQIEGYEDLIRKASYVIIMTVKCGRSGQVFEESAMNLVAEVRALNPQIKIIVDGGVNENNIFLLKKTGVNVAVVGNYAKKCYENDKFEIGINRLLRD